MQQPSYPETITVGDLADRIQHRHVCGHLHLDRLVIRDGVLGRTGHLAVLAQQLETRKISPVAAGSSLRSPDGDSAKCLHCSRTRTFSLLNTEDRCAMQRTFE